MTTAMSVWQNGAQLAALLDRGVLFTHAAERWSGDEVVTKVTSREGRSALLPDEHRHLESWRDGTQAGSRREGTIVTLAGGERVAEVSSVFLPGRIGDEDVLRRLYCEDIPLGKALHVLGVRRRTVDSRMLACGPFAVVALGVLSLPDGRPVALAREQVYREFCRERG
jgi:hypothetical protein